MTNYQYNHGQCLLHESPNPQGEPEAKASAKEKTEAPKPEPDPDELAEAKVTLETARTKGYEVRGRIKRWPVGFKYRDGEVETKGRAKVYVHLLTVPGRYVLYGRPSPHDAFDDGGVYDKAYDRIVEETGSEDRAFEEAYKVFEEFLASHEGYQRDLRALTDFLETVAHRVCDYCFLVRTDLTKDDGLDLVTGAKLACASDLSFGFGPFSIIDRKQAEALPPLDALTLYTAEDIKNGLLAAGVGYWPGMSVGGEPVVRFVRPWLPEAGVVCLYGREGVGKTTWLIDELMAAACNHEAVVVYFAIDGKADAGLRVAAAYEKHGWGLPPLFIASSATDLDLGNAGSGWQTLEGEVEAAVKRCKTRFPEATKLPVVAVVETLSTALNGADENGQGTARFLRGACNFVGAGDRQAFLFTHHPDGKGVKPRGFSAIMGDCDLVLKAHGRPDGTVSVMADKFRMGKKGTVFATYRVVPTEKGSTVSVEPVQKREQPTPPKELEKRAERDAWLALEAVGASDGLDEEEVTEILARVVNDKSAKPSTLRMRRKRVHRQHL